MNVIDLNLLNSANEPTCIMQIAGLTIVAGEDSDQNSRILTNIFHELNSGHFITSDRSSAFMMADNVDLNSMPESVSETFAGNIKFVQNLSNITLQNSFIAEYHPDIIIALENIMGGSLSYTSTKGLVFHKANKNGPSKDMPLFLASKVVRNLAYIYLYLKHAVNHSETLLIEEPEMAMHPRLQMQMTRILNMLVNAGVRIVMTTHSDHMVREFNALIALGSMSQLPTDDDRLSYRVFDTISNSMMLHYNQVSLYGVSHGMLSDKLTVNANGLDLYTFDRALGMQNELFSAVDNLVCYDQNVR